MIEAALWTGGALMLAYPLAALHWLGYRSWKSATATVVRFQIDPSPSADQGMLKAPVLRFQPEGADWIEIIDPVFSHSRLRVGSKVRIRYPATSPSHARLASDLYTIQLSAGTFGLFLFIIGMLGSG